MKLPDAKLFVARFVKGDHTPEEYATFLRWLESASEKDLEVIAQEYEAFYDDWVVEPTPPSQAWVDQLEAKLDQVEEEVAQSHTVSINRRRPIRRVIGRVAAASVVLAVGIGSYFIYTHQQGQGQKEVVSDVNNGVLSKQFAVARGGQQQQYTLPDGSVVWLNAASTLTYSTAGSDGPARLVELNGEAYFSISKNASLPFKIRSAHSTIEVLGTEFNLRAYADEPVSKATLVSGSIKVIDGSEEAMLKPGEQAMITYADGASTMKVSKVESLDAVSSWKDGTMEFRNDDLKTVMTQIARCYNLSVEFEQGAATDRRFSGVLSRKSTINQIIVQLAHEGVHCKLDGSKIVVIR